MEGIHTELRGTASWITLDSPRGNALHPAMVSSLLAAIDDAEARTDTTAVVITGAGDVFCRGWTRPGSAGATWPSSERA